MDSLYTPGRPALVDQHVDLDRLASEANATIVEAEQCSTRSVQLYALAGHRLLTAKAGVGTGNWQTWAKKNLRCTLRQAQRYMKLADVGQPQHLEAQWKILSGHDDESQEPQEVKCENAQETTHESFLPADDSQGNGWQDVTTETRQTGKKKQGNPYPLEKRCKKCRLDPRRDLNRCKGCRSRNAVERGGGTPNANGRRPGVPYCDRHTNHRADPDCIDCLELQRDWRDKKLEKQYWVPLFDRFKKLAAVPGEITEYFQIERCPESEAVARLIGEAMAALRALKKKLSTEKASAK